MLQNRVKPTGELVAVSDRGALMGNRGILHNQDKKVVRKWQHKSWVTCLLTFGDLQRPKPFSTLDNYSELFFLDEATAFAAGHRPCHFCQRDRAKQFKDAWSAANKPGAGFVPQGDLDAQLHRERTTRTGVKVTFEERAGELPFGTMFSVGEACYLVSKTGYLLWSFGGYGPGRTLSQDALVTVLTPKSVVAAFRQGFLPDVHPSAMCA